MVLGFRLDAVILRFGDNVGREYMTQFNNLASRLLKFEQQLAAYQKLHADELAERWRVLDECKCALVAALPSQESNQYLKDSLAVTEELRDADR